jgi:predicted MFS family arabinose efflux permease
VAAIALIILVAWVDPPRKPERESFDFAGLVTLIAGLTLLVFAIMQGGTWGWTQAIILACLAGGIAVIALFVAIERRRGAPLIEVDLIANASFSACIFVIFVGQFSKIAIVVFGALYLQDKLGMSPLTAGLALLASVAAFPFLSAPAGRLADKYGARPLVLSGIALATLAMFWLGFAAAWDSYVLLLPGLIGWGLGMPLCYAPALRAMANSVPLEKQGQASGIGVTSRLLGGAIGMAVGSSLLVTTGSFEVVFLATAGVMLVAVLFGFFAIERGGGAQIP